MLRNPGGGAVDLSNLTATWDAGGTTFTAIKMNVTDSASAADSKLLDLQRGGSSMFSVDKFGAVNPTTNFTFSSNFYSQYATGLLIGGSAGGFAWSNSGSLPGTPDLKLLRDAANTLAQRNGTSAQAFRLYRGYTDSSNYTRGALQTAANTIELAAESAGTGDANIDILFTPKGTGNVKFGTHSAIAAETITGYITIKDAGGTSRKLAVVS